MSYQRSPGPALLIRHTGQVFPLRGTPVTMGRASENDIILSDPQVSRHHATIFWQDGRYFIQDLGSANGTYVDERRITQPVPLRHGSVIRLGNTVLDMQLVPDTGPTQHMPASLADYEPDAAEPSRSRAPLIIGLLVAGIVVVGLALVAILALAGGGRSKPTVTIQMPVAGTQIAANTEIILQATATGARNITRLEISVDGALVGLATSPDPQGQASLTTTQPWRFGEAGPHVVSAVAYTARGQSSTPASVTVAVAGTVAQGTPSASPETAEPTLTPSTTPLPTEPPPTPLPSDTPLPEVPSDTPTPTPTATQTPTPTPTPTKPPPPQIAFFQANPATIIAGGCTTLEWGAVTNATEVSIDQGIGGVATPGSRNVCPTETTTYILTATGPGGTSTASATVTVSAAQPDLVVQSITFAPDPPVQNQDNQVRIAIRNAGSGDAGPFDWEWRPGTATPQSGHASGLHAGETMLVTVTWHPGSWYASLPTVARVDTGNTVGESNEGNNELTVNTQVVAPSEVTVTRPSQAALDGYVIGGQDAYNAQDIRAGNFGTASGEAVYRGFFSFDLSGIPAAATIQSVELRFFQAEVVGDPYGKLPQLLLVHLDYGSSLDPADFDIAGLEPDSTAWLSPRTSPGESYIITSETIANWIGQDLAAGRTRLQMRLQFLPEIDDGATADYIRIESGDNALGTGHVPQLTITYTP
jgi:predicted component of type VI protein secretion system